MPNWTIKIVRKAEKALENFPAKDQRMMLVAFDAMTINSFFGDLKHLHNQKASWRRRAGRYRIFFDIYPDLLLVDIVEINRRTSKTY